MCGGSRSTPVVDGNRVYALGTDGDLLCAGIASGKPVWRRNLARDFSGRMMFAGDRYDWRFSESPLVDGPMVGGWTPVDSGVGGGPPWFDGLTARPSASANSRSN